MYVCERLLNAVWTDSVLPVLAGDVREGEAGCKVSGTGGGEHGVDDKAVAGVHCGGARGGGFDVEGYEGMGVERETGEGGEGYGAPVAGIGGGAGSEDDHWMDHVPQDTADSVRDVW